MSTSSSIGTEAPDQRHGFANNEPYRSLTLNKLIHFLVRIGWLPTDTKDVQVPAAASIAPESTRSNFGLSAGGLVILPTCIETGKRLSSSLPASDSGWAVRQRTKKSLDSRVNSGIS